ncbi:hypothetical protein D5R93_12000 [Actinomyces lilanjuaniae]|uniref:Uncharacterized protein n=1 Tax=Actinomyces lilanjuaniae TaxID=2321394 RepID=A0ABN5PRX7_9ACTO|nr:hypothetical protein D5R93_12000 [Actinomyces lilanjuaniae]
MNGGLMILIGLAMCAILTRMVSAFQEPAGAGSFLLLIGLIRTVGLAMGLGAVVAGVVPLRQRTVFDATGIHSRGLLRTRHLPWPCSRAAFVVDVSVRRDHASPSRTGVSRRGAVTVLGRVEVSAGGRRTRLAARVSRRSAGKGFGTALRQRSTRSGRGHGPTGTSATSGPSLAPTGRPALWLPRRRAVPVVCRPTRPW